MRPILAGFILALTFLAPVSSGVAGEWGTDNFYASPHRAGPWNGPACDEPKVLDKLLVRFNKVEKEYWGDDLQMQAIASPREAATRQWDPPLIATRFCSASAYFTDGRRREIVYRLRSEQGFAGVGWGFEYCVIGLDRLMAYSPACQMLRPL